MKKYKYFKEYIEHLKASRDYWIMIAVAEKEKNIKLQSQLEEYKKGKD